MARQPYLRAETALGRSDIHPAVPRVDRRRILSPIFHKSTLEEQELKRRADTVRVRAILEPKDEEARARVQRLRREAEERHAAEIEQQKTQRFAILLLIALLATTLTAAVRWLMLN